MDIRDVETMEEGRIELEFALFFTDDGTRAR
jgi:hypothetical protein